MLTLKEVSLRKGKRTYLDEVSFTAEAGRITAIVGTRSAGRTELAARRAEWRSFRTAFSAILESSTATTETRS